MQAFELRIRLAICLSFLLLCEGCTAYAPKIVLDQNGLSNSTTVGSSSINAFNAHYKALYDKTFTNTANNFSQSTVVTPMQLTAEGASLAYQFCSSFFKTAGTEQQYLLFSRDLIGVFGTLATGVLGATHGSPAATAWVGIASGTALSGISIYTRNFLFSEDNVQAVQDLTLKAMTAQTTASLALARSNPNYGFFDSIQDIMDIQAVCEVQKILSLVRQSIGQAEPVASASSGGKVSTDVGPQQSQIATPQPLLITSRVPNTSTIQVLLAWLKRDVANSQLLFNWMQTTQAASVDANLNGKVVSWILGAGGNPGESSPQQMESDRQAAIKHFGMTP